MKHIEMLEKIGACHEGVEFAKGFKSMNAAWIACERGDWLLWYAGRVCGDDRRQLVLAACACARLALKHVPEGEDRPLKAIETAEAWARGEGGVTIKDVRLAAAYAADAAYAAAYAADAAYAAANADYAAAYAAAKAANAAAANAANAAYANAAAAYATDAAATYATDAYADA